MVDYRIYLHGRPQGQDIWSSKAEIDKIDRFYLEPYLDVRPGNNVGSALIVDIWQKRTYYTFIHCKNVIEKTSRPNAYAAITVCLNGAICHKVATLYKLLDQVFQKIVIGNFLDSNNGEERFLVSQFHEKEAIAKQINDLIAKNFEALIASSCETLEQSKDTKDVSPKFYNFNDVDSPVFLSDVEKSRVIVSAEFLSKDKSVDEARKKIDPMNLQISDLNTKLGQSQSKIAVLESEKSSLSSTVASLQVDIKTLESKVSSIETETKKKFAQDLESKDKQLQQAKASFEQDRKDLESKIKVLIHKCDELERQKKDPSININSSEELLRLMAERFPIGKKNSEKGQNPTSKCFGLLSNISLWVSAVNFILLGCVLALLLCSSLNPFIEKKDPVTTSGRIQYPVQTMENPEQYSSFEPTTELEKSTPDCTMQSNPYEGLYIDLKGYSGGYKVGSTYACSLKKRSNSNPNSQIPTVITWSVESGDADFQDCQLTISDSVSVVIKCMDSNENLIDRRTLNVLK